jgi:hypothetical protein
MEQLTIIVDDRVGLLADISYLLGKSNINIISVQVISIGGKAILSFLVKNRKKAIEILKSAGYKVLEYAVLVIKLEDKPGQLAALSSLLVKENINILNLYFISKEKGFSILALRVDKIQKAKKLLSNYLVKERI